MSSISPLRIKQNKVASLERPHHTQNQLAAGNAAGVQVQFLRVKH